MAQFQATAIPKIPSLLWLQQDDKHRAYAVFTRGLGDQIKSRRADSTLWDNIGEYNIDDDVFEHIVNAGFGGVFTSGFHKIDHALITALVERWRPETHTFHLPVGEATVTLQDVQVLLGLPIDGPAVTGTWVHRDYDYWAPIVNEALGFYPLPSDIKGGNIRIKVLIRHLDDGLERTEECFRQRARLYILAILGGYLFSDSSSIDVSLNYLQNLQDLSVAGRLSWGSAALAYLYRQLCNTAAKWDTTGIQGPLLLLHFWAWARIPSIAPTIRTHGQNPDYEYCYAVRWDFPMSHIQTPAHVLATYRSALTALRREDFNWQPYAHIWNSLPANCTSGQALWGYHGWLVCWNIVEPHPIDRVTRQLGYVQDIPSDELLMSPHTHVRIHSMRKTGRTDVNWLARHESYIAIWNGRLGNQWRFGAPGFTTVHNYMQWYYDRTVLCITNPGAAPPDNRYPDWGGQQQAYQEGYRHIHDRARQLMDSQAGSSQALQEFMQIPQQLFEFHHNVERIQYGSQQFQFPEPGYHPDPPNTQAGGAYNQPSSFGGYYTPQPPPPPQEDSFVNQLFGDTPDYNTMPPNYNISPVQMGSLSEFGQSQNPSGSRNRATNLAFDEDEDETEPTQPRGRGHRRHIRRGCGTDGHY